MATPTPVCCVSQQAIRENDTAVMVPIRLQSNLISATEWVAYSGDQRQARHSTPWLPHSGSIRVARRVNHKSGFAALISPVDSAHLVQLVTSLYHRGGVRTGVSVEPFYALRAHVEGQAPNLTARMKNRPVKDLAALQLELVACWHVILGVALQRRLYVADDQGLSHPFGFAVMHEATYELLGRLRADTRIGNERMEPSRYVKRALAAARQAVLPDGVATLTDDSKLLPAAVERVKQELQALVPCSLPVATLKGNDDVLVGYFTGRNDDIALYQAIQAWLSDAYAFAGMDLIQLALAPLTMAYDDTDEAGERYAKLVRDVRRDLKPTQGFR